VEWPGGVDLCPDTMHQAMTGAETELHSPMALHEEKKNHSHYAKGGRGAPANGTDLVALKSGEAGLETG
jgi:hypothetical protein